MPQPKAYEDKDGVTTGSETSFQLAMERFKKQAPKEFAYGRTSNEILIEKLIMLGDQKCSA